MSTLAKKHFNFLIPSVIGGIEGYIQAVNRIPMLSEEEEISLGKRFQEHEDLEAAKILVLSHLRLVVSIARQYLGYGLPHADLIQEGNVGLMKAVKRFDPNRGVRLVSFATHWIKAEIHEFILRNWRTVKIATTKAQRKLFFNLRGMKKHLASLTPSEIDNMAKTLGVKTTDVQEMEMRLQGNDIPVEIEGDDDNTVSPITYLVSPEAEPIQVLEAEQEIQNTTYGLSKALENLDERSRRIIQARWLKEEEKENATLKDLADELGVSIERIRQIEKKAMEKMRLSLSA